MNTILGNLPAALASPRIEGGVLTWYRGDTFDVQVDILLTDQDGDTVPIGPDDAVTLCFRDHKQRIIKQFHYTDILGSAVVLRMDADTSALFDPGQYTCDVTLTGDRRVTLSSRCPVLVQ